MGRPLAVALVLLLSLSLAQAQCYYNLTEDYIAVMPVNPNPGGSPGCPWAQNVWTFEQVTAGGVIASLATWNPQYANNTNFGAWQGTEMLSPVEYMPSFAKNYGTTTINWSNNKLLPPGIVTTHPASTMDGQLRWTAPQAGSYQYYADLRLIQNPICGDGISFNLTVPSASRLLQQQSIAAGGEYSFTAPIVVLTAGQSFVLTIDRSGAFQCDTTALDIVITRVDPPTTPPPVPSTTVPPTPAPTPSLDPPTTTATTSATSSTDSTSTTETSSTTSSLSNSLNIAIGGTRTSASTTATTGTPPVPDQQVLVVEQDMFIANSWSAPPVIVFNGGSIQVSGTAYITGSEARVQVSDEQGDSTQRVNLVQATQSIQGSFDNIEVMPPRNGDVKSADGRCVDYFVGSEDRNSNSLSVLVAAKPSKCESQRFSPWVYVGVTVGIIGILVVALGVLIVVRDTAQRWARIVAVADDEAIY